MLTESKRSRQLDSCDCQFPESPIAMFMFTLVLINLSYISMHAYLCVCVCRFVCVCMVVSMYVRVCIFCVYMYVWLCVYVCALVFSYCPNHFVKVITVVKVWPQFCSKIQAGEHSSSSAGAAFASEPPPLSVVIPKDPGTSSWADYK